MRKIVENFHKKIVIDTILRKNNSRKEINKLRILDVLLIHP